MLDMRFSHALKAVALDQLGDTGEPCLHIQGERQEFGAYRFIMQDNSPIHYRLYQKSDIEASLMCRNRFSIAGEAIARLRLAAVWG
jgi:hypothetical protein